MPSPLKKHLASIGSSPQSALINRTVARDAASPAALLLDKGARLAPRRRHVPRRPSSRGTQRLLDDRTHDVARPAVHSSIPGSDAGSRRFARTRASDAGGVNRR